MAIQGEIGWL